jgi:hypothetical protein
VRAQNAARKVLSSIRLSSSERRCDQMRDNVAEYSTFLRLAPPPVLLSQQ